MKHYYTKFCTVILLVVLMSLTATQLKAQLLINEGFNTVLPAGWAQQNLSTPAGTNPLWFQGNATVFPAFSGAATAYAACNFNSIAGAGTISNWMFTPQVALVNGNVISFYARTTTGDFPDRLELRMSTNGASVNVGASNTSVGDFTTLLVSVNPTLTNSGFPLTWTKFTATISGLPAATTGRFAFRYFVEDGGPAGNNSDFIGVDEVQYGTPCTGTPAPGNTISTAATICPTVPFTLSLQNQANGLGVTYQWQSSATGAPGSFTNIAGATNNTLTTSQTAATYYQAVVTCGAASGTSTPIQVGMLLCYCPATATSTAFEKISRVTFGSINNASTSTAGYEDFTAISGNVYIGATMPITVTLAGGFAADQTLVWIDFNKDFDFDDAGELVYTSLNSAGPHTGNVTIPASVTAGATRMRVRMHDTSLGANSTPCGASSYGQVEDYTVNLVPCVPATVTTQPANASIACGNNTSFTVALAGSDSSAYWQYRTSTSTNWLDVPNAAPYSGVNTTTLTITGVNAALNGYQYRVVYKGACTGASFSNAATLTVTALVPVVNPASATICLGTVQQLSLTNSVAAENTVTFSATGLPGIIPDNDLTNPLDKTIAVSGIPAGSVIKNVRVRMNVNHTWVGDMVANLTAPNGQTLNLFALMAGLTGSNGTANFTNTVFDSLATTGIAAAPAPRTGNFKPEAYLLTGPANFVTTTAYWAPLWGTINGNWRVRFADAGAGDVGTVTALEITIVYTAPGLAQGVWAPAASIFTDAAGTVPYTGTPATTVYVKPTTPGVTNYTVSYSTGVCQSGSTTVAVTARQLPTSVSAVTNKSICQGGNTSFSSTVTGGSPSGLQWQVSTDNGTTYTNVTDGGVYSGATTSTLNITGAGTNISNGRYRLVASAAPCTGTLASTAGILTVNPLPVLGLSTSLASIYPGQTATLTVTSSTTVPAGGYTWYRNGVIVPGATGNTLVVDVDGVGEYTVTAADANGCGNAVPASVSVTSAPNEMMFIYPSPNTGVFQIRYFSAAGNNPLPRMVNIYDSKGARVYSKTYTVAMPYTKLDVDMTGFQKGIYQVELSDRNGNRIKTGRVLIL